MKVSKILGALIEGILFAILMWVGDKYILENDNPWWVYVLQAVIFAVLMFLYDRFFSRKKDKS